MTRMNTAGITNSSSSACQSRSSSASSFRMSAITRMSVPQLPAGEVHEQFFQVAVPVLDAAHTQAGRD